MNQHEYKTDCIRGFLKACEDMTRIKEPFVWRIRKTVSFIVKIKAKNKVTKKHSRILYVHVGLNQHRTSPKVKNADGTNAKDEDGIAKRLKRNPDG